MKPSNLSWPDYLRMGVGRRLSKLGERTGNHWLTYNPIHFRHFHDLALRDARSVISILRETFPQAKSLVDVGAGSGGFAAEALRFGFNAVACEHSATGRRYARKQGVDVRPFDLNLSPPTDIRGPADLAICFEVGEHLPPELGDRLVSFLAMSSPLVVFSSAQPGQGGTGHINEQPPGYWRERFEREGMQERAETTRSLREKMEAADSLSGWFPKNTLCFERRAKHT